MATTTNGKRADVYTRVTSSIIEQLERGVRPWMRPWSAEHAAGRISPQILQLRKGQVLLLAVPRHRPEFGLGLGIIDAHLPRLFLNLRCASRELVDERFIDPRHFPTMLGPLDRQPQLA